LKEKDALLSIVIAVEVDDPDLVDRLTSLLADVPGVRLAAPGEKADVSLVLPEHAAATDTNAGLTPREMEVLELLAEGASNKTIALRLGISVHTAKFHVRSLIDNLDATIQINQLIHSERPSSCVGSATAPHFGPPARII
jgi:DNA-binding CsgD family transcriptional regulator